MPTVTTQPPDWRVRAACRNVADPDLFFPVSDDDQAPATAAQIEQAKAVCASCPVRRQCLDFATETRQREGVWGGTTWPERRLSRRRALARNRGAA